MATWAAGGRHFFSLSCGLLTFVPTTVLAFVPTTVLAFVPSLHDPFALLTFSHIYTCQPTLLWNCHLFCYDATHCTFL